MLQKRESTFYQWILSILANIPVLTYGIATGWLSSASRVLQSEESPAGYPLTSEMISWMASSLPFVAAFGSLFAAKLSDRIGRKYSLMLLSVPQALTWSIKAYSANPVALLVARVLCGFSAGGCFVVPPMYVREISSMHVRGALGSLIMAMMNLGFLIAYILGSQLEYFTIIWICLPLPFMHLVLSTMAPETPAYLVKLGKVEEARRVVGWLRGLNSDDKAVVAQVSEMEEDAKQMEKIISFKSILDDVAKRRALMVCLFMLLVHAGGGSASVLNYAASILQTADAGADADLQAVAVGALVLLGSLISIVLSKHVGRKPLLLSSASVMMVMLTILGAPAMFTSLGVLTSPVPSWLPVVALAGVVFSYATGLGPVPYVIMSEIFSFETRGALSGVNVMFAWTVTGVQLAIFGPLADALGNIVFLLFAALNLLGVCVLAVYLPETRGCTLAHIEQKLRGNHKSLPSV